MGCFSALFNWPHSLGKSPEQATITQRKLSLTNALPHRYHESTFEETYDYHQADACLAGLGTGLLSTAAVSLSPTLADIPLAGAEVIRIAFRLGVLVDEVSRNLQPRSVDWSHGDSWAYVVQDSAEEVVQSELDAIQVAEVRSIMTTRLLT